MSCETTGGAQTRRIWEGEYKIPWNEPGFSRRMLAVHLSQHHDMASRRLEWIDRQVEWIHSVLCTGQPANILDLGCGPGFYSHRLASRGHRCRGLDFSPASIEYARRHNPAHAQCEFVSGDIRRVEFGGPYDLAMLLFGEANVFSPEELRDILRRARACLDPARGALIVEAQTFQAVERSGNQPPKDEHFDAGLFSDRPYRCRKESEWLPDDQAAVQTFTIRDAAGGVAVYRNTTKAWSDTDFASLLAGAGFAGVTRRGDWPCNTADLVLWSAERA